MRSVQSDSPGGADSVRAPLAAEEAGLARLRGPRPCPTPLARLVRRRRFAASLLVGFLIALAGCGDNTAADADRVKFLWFGNETETRAIGSLVQAFERDNPGCHVDVTTIEWNKYTEKVVTMMLGGRSPDLARMSVQHVARFGELGALADVSSCFSKEELADFDPARLASCRTKGGLVGLPQSSIGLVVYYNKDAFRRIGVVPPPTVHDAWTLEEFSEVARRLQSRGGVKYGWGTFRGFFSLVPFIYMYGGSLFAPDLVTPQFSSPPVLDAIQWFVDQHRRGIAPPTSWSTGGDNVDRLFVLGRCGMVIHGSWMISNYEKRIRDFDWGVTYLPRGLHAATNIGGENLVVFRTPRTAAAVKLLKYLTSADAVRTFCSQARFIPTRQSLLHGRFEYASRGDLMQVVLDQSRVFRPAWGREQSSPAFVVIADQLCARVELAILGSCSVGDAMRDLAADLKGLR
jgi:ABC-type glycerol-3-phosphate transport system substrate-binding protein